MKVESILAKMLVKIAHETYSEYLVTERGRARLYLILLKAVYGQLVARLPWYLAFRKDLQSIGFVFNPYNACVSGRLEEANRQFVSMSTT